MTADVEEHTSAHQAGLGEGHDAVTVGVKVDLTGRAEFDQGHTAAGILVDDLNREGLDLEGTRILSAHRRREEQDGEVVGNQMAVHEDGPLYGIGKEGFE